MPSALSIIFFAALALLIASDVPARAAIPNAASGATFYVAPAGNDSWSGNLAVANAAKTDGPFATIGRARQTAKTLARAGGARPVGAVTVLLRGGFYPLTKPLSFDASDSGSADAPIVYAAYPGETPIVSGGERITGWKQVRPGRWEVTLSAVRQGDWYFSQLYVNGERRLRPRLPREGYYYIGSPLDPTNASAGLGYDRFRYRPGDVDPKMQNRGDIELVAFHNWTISRFHIADIDTATRTISFTGHTQHEKDAYGLPRGNRYLMENVKEALSEPGRWYLDRATGVLTYLAKSGEDPNRDMVVAPRLPFLAEMNGVTNVTFRGITFADAAWNSTPNGNSWRQAEIDCPAAIRLTGCRDCALEACTVRNIGIYAIKLGAGTKRCVIEGCTLEDLGGGGVLMGEETTAPDVEQQATDNTVKNCLIAGGGRIHPAAVGVWIGQSSHNQVVHNEIVDFYYSGISAGWSWGYKANGCHDNTIAYNHIHQIGQSVLSDMGGIYTLGPSPGTVIDHNLIHDVNAYDYGGWGIYFDEGSSGILATNNVVYDTKSSPFVQHYGQDNIVRNNILAYGREAQIMRTKAEDHLAFTLEQNIIYWKDASVTGSPWNTDWSGHGYALDRNLYWDSDSRVSMRFAGATFPEWQAKGFDAGSLIADPLFVAPERRDFRLKPDSPASKIGFIPIDIQSAGRMSGSPYTYHATPTYPKADSSTLFDNWEDMSPGDKPGAPNLFLVEEPAVPAATVRVTNETAASGTNSLKFTDAAGQKSVDDPKIYYKPRLFSGTATAGFALRMEPGAVFATEWRDAETPYHTGPSLWIGSDGVLMANGKALGTLPKNEWLHFQIVCTLGSGTYDLTITVPGRANVLSYPGLPCNDGADFCSFRWWSFAAIGDGSGVFYLDDVSLTAR